MQRNFALRLSLTCFALIASPQTVPTSAAPAPAAASMGALPGGEKLTYSVEWRLIYAGNAQISLNRENKSGSPEWESKLHLESGGIVSKLYKLDDNYRVQLEDQFCATASQFDAIEGKRHRQTKVTFDRSARKATYLETDLLKNTVIKKAETEIPPCVSDIIGSIYKLRTLRLDPGQSAQVPVSDGTKSVAARVEAKDKEEVITKAGKFNTVRYEAFVFNGVLYKKSGRLEIWMTDDGRKLPVQYRARMAFPVGTITFQLEKEDRT